MIDVNLITDLLIQHSQSTGFEKSLEMLTQTLRQLTDPNTGSPVPTTATATATTATSSQSSSQLAQSNTFENLLLQRLQPSIPPTVLPTPVTSQVWFNSTAPQTYPSAVPPFFPATTGQQPPNVSMDFHSLQQYQNQRH